MGWTQPRSPIQVDNSTAEGFANNTIIIKRMRAIEMRLNWLNVNIYDTMAPMSFPWFY
jgi:hypothetical protein